MALTSDQITEINGSNRSQVTQALNELNGAKRFAHYVLTQQAIDLEAALRARLAELDDEDDQAKIDSAIEKVNEIIHPSE
jgi:enoyl-CoA hydratase/carnithine racemase